VFIIADGPSFTQHTRVAGYYMGEFEAPYALIVPSTYCLIIVGGFYYCTIWAARLSIIFTVVRIAPWASQKRVMLVVALVLLLQWLLLVVQMFWVCEKGNTAWKKAPFALCPLGLHVAITQAVSEYQFIRPSISQRLRFLPH